MSQKNFINFLKKHQNIIIALIIAVILFAISLSVNILVIFFNDGYSIAEREKQDLHYMLASGLSLSITSILAYFYYRISKNKYKLLYSLAILLPLFYNIYVLAIVLTRFVDKSNYYETWNIERWDKEKPLKMARKLCKDKALIGMSKDSVLLMVGYGEASKYTHSDKDSWVYETSRKYFYFVIVFQNDTVADTYLYENWKH
jgi:hypothetical protein